MSSSTSPLLTSRAAIPRQIRFSYDIVINSDSKRVDNKKNRCFLTKKPQNTVYQIFLPKFLELKANSGMILAGLGMSLKKTDAEPTVMAVSCPSTGPSTRIISSKLMWVALLVCLALASAGKPAYAAKYAAIVIEEGSGRVLFARNADKLRYPASLTKIMTL